MVTARYPQRPASIHSIPLFFVMNRKQDFFYSIVAVMPEPGGLGGPLAPLIFGRSVNPISTGEGRLSPPITTGTPNVFHLPESLSSIPINVRSVVEFLQ